MTVRPVVPYTGDFARRVNHRQSELGLSTEDLAELTGMDAGYLKYLKTSPSVSLPAGALVRLADSLGTTAIALAGGEVDRSPGSGRAGIHPVLEVLSPDQCEEHLQSGGVGRVVYSTARGPVALPVNFATRNGDVVFRTDESMAAGIETNETVGFEVDRIDDAMSAGWSVLVSGTPHRVEDPIGRRHLATLGIEPWAGGSRDVLMRITSCQISGRVIVQYEDSVRRARPTQA
jgi:transcriptional regulator with XRE-family HTH domain